ncbi:RCC1 domain-containing protein [Hymenobacter humi]|uniref:RCC1 domain-containing protein n=1 Tax=Hymenobacter humi TaxID=1411620 RepID=A0ABW2UES1_9BACT
MGLGRGSAGRLGDGTNTQRTAPVQIGTGTNWRSVAAGWLHSVAVRTDGTLWAWGANYVGQVGAGFGGSNSTFYAPVQLGTATTWQSVSAGRDHSLAVRTDGTLWGWGNNNYGQLGPAPFSPRYVPTQVGTATTWQSSGVGLSYSLAVRTDGTLWAGGNNDYGMLGDGTTTVRTALVQIGTDATWQRIEANYGQSLAVRTDGTLWAWGLNTQAQLGDGTLTNRLAPVQIGTGTTWQSASAGDGHGLAVRTDGTLWAWGSQGSGQLGIPWQSAVPLLIFTASGPLPVELVSFTARRTGPRTVALAWRTASEQNNAGFTIEHSPTGASLPPWAPWPATARAAPPAPTLLPPSPPRTPRTTAWRNAT